MSIWKISVVEGYEWVKGLERADNKALFEIYRLRSTQPWPKVRVEMIREDEGQRFREADFPWRSSSVIVLRPRVLPVVEDMLLRHGELLPLQCNDAEVLAYNCTTVIDALDHGQSEIMRFPSSGRVMRIVRHVFVPERLEGIDLFRLPDFDQGGPIYVSDAFRHCVLDAGLTGLVFDLK